MSFAELQRSTLKKTSKCVEQQSHFDSSFRCGTTTNCLWVRILCALCHSTRSCLQALITPCSILGNLCCQTKICVTCVEAHTVGWRIILCLGASDRATACGGCTFHVLRPGLALACPSGPCLPSNAFLWAYYL